MAQLASGDLLAGYRIDALAGRGGMGVVYSATQLALDRRVALKLITPDLAEDANFRDRFKRESRTAASIEHPNVIPVYEAGEADGQLFIAMRFIDGIDLRELIRREGAIEPARLAPLVAQVASALDAAHARGLVHRDIKPGNVLMASEDGRDHAYLTDFGLSKRLSSESGVTGTGLWVGTVDYISPEQIRGAELDARSDVYSLGCLLYHAVTGQVPFERDSDVAKIFAHMSEPPPVPSEVRMELPDGLDVVARRAMAKDPADRYPSAGDLGRATLAALEGRRVAEPERTVATGAAAPTAATVAAATRAAPGAPPRRRVPLAALAALGAVVATVAVLALVGAFSSDDGGDTGPAAGAFQERSVLVTPIAIDSPGGMAIGDGGLWVASYDADRITRIDLESGALGDPISVGDAPNSIAIAGGFVWVVNEGAGTVSKVDVDSGQVVGNPIDLPSTGSTDSIAATDKRVWVAAPDRGRIITIDAATGGRGTPIVPPDGSVGELALGDGALWVVGDHGTVSRINAETGEAGEPVTVGKEIPPDSTFRGEVVVGEGAVWVAALDDETVVRLDPSDGKVVATIPIKDGIESDIAAGDGAVWVVDESGRMIRIDPATNKASPDRLPSGTVGVYDMTAGGGAVWIAGESQTNTITRIAP